MSDKLDLILQKLTQMDSRISAIETGQKQIQQQLIQTNEIVKAIQERQEEADAKLDALTNDIHDRFDKTDRTLRFLESDFDVMYKKIVSMKEKLVA